MCLLQQTCHQTYQYAIDMTIQDLTGCQPVPVDVDSKNYES